MFGMGLTTPIRTLLIFESVNMRALGVAEQAAIDATRSIHVQAQKLLMGGAALAAGVVAPMAFAASHVKKVAAEMDLLMQKIDNVNQYGPAKLAGLREAFNKISKETGASPIDIAGAGYEAAQANYTQIADILNIAKTASKLSIASGWEVDAKTAADQFTRLAQAFDLPISKSVELGDALMRTQQIGKMSFQQILAHSGKAASNYGALARERGIDPVVAMREYFAMAATGSLAGLNADQMFTAMRGVMSRVFTESGQKGKAGKNGGIPTSKMNQFAARYGFSDAEKMLSSVGMIEFLRRAQDATNGFGGSLHTLGFHQRELTAVTALMKNGMKDLDDNFAKITDSSGRMDKAWLANLGTIKGLEMAMSSAFDRASASWGEALKPWIYGLYKVLKALGDVLADMPTWTKHVVIFAGAITTLATAILMLRGVATFFRAQSLFNVALSDYNDPRRRNGQTFNPALYSGGHLTAKQRSGAPAGALGYLPFLFGAHFGNRITRNLKGAASSFWPKMPVASGAATIGVFQAFSRKTPALIGATNNLSGYIKRLTFAIRSGLALGVAGVSARHASKFFRSVGGTAGKNDYFALSRTSMTGGRAKKIQHGSLSSGAIGQTLAQIAFYWGIVERRFLGGYITRAWNVLKALGARIFVFAMLFAAGFSVIYEEFAAFGKTLKELYQDLQVTFPDIGKFLADVVSSPGRALSAIFSALKAIIYSIATPLNFLFNVLFRVGELFGVFADMVQNVATSVTKSIRLLMTGHPLEAGSVVSATLKSLASSYMGVGKVIKDASSDTMDTTGGKAWENWKNMWSSLSDTKPQFGPVADKMSDKSKPETAALVTQRFTSAAVYGTAAAWNQSITVSLLQQIANNTDPNNRKSKAVELQQYDFGG